MCTFVSVSVCECECEALNLLMGIMFQMYVNSSQMFATHRIKSSRSSHAFRVSKCDDLMYVYARIAAESLDYNFIMIKKISTFWTVNFCDKNN